MIQISDNLLASTIIQSLENQRDTAIVALANLTVEVAILKQEAEALRAGLVAKDAELAALKPKPEDLLPALAPVIDMKGRADGN